VPPYYQAQKSSFPAQIFGAAKPLKKIAFIRVHSWLNGFAFGCGSAALCLRGGFLAFFASLGAPLRNGFSIRNAIGNRFSPLFTRLVADVRIEALFLDTLP